MITKYDMSSGAPIVQADASCASEDKKPSHELIAPQASLQLVAAVTEPEPVTMPLDMTTCSISEFLSRQ